MAHGSGFDRYPKIAGGKQELSKEVMHDLAKLTSWYLNRNERREEEEQTRAMRTAQIILEQSRMEAEQRQKQFVNLLVVIAFSLAVGFGFGWHYRGTGF